MASTGSAEFLPVRLAADRQEPLGDPSLLDALDLGRGRWVLVLETAPGLLTSAVVEERDGFRRARAGDGVAEGLLAKTASGEGRGSFAFRRLGTIGAWSGERPIEVDQSNE